MNRHGMIAHQRHRFPDVLGFLLGRMSRWPRRVLDGFGYFAYVVVYRILRWRRRLAAISGVVPGQFDRPPGCLFAPRCEFATSLCHSTAPKLNDGALCHYPLRKGQPQGHPGKVKAA